MSSMIGKKSLMARVKAWLGSARLGSARLGGAPPATSLPPKASMPSSNMISEIFEMPMRSKPTPPQSAGKGT
jgi:hypothetical protein